MVEAERGERQSTACGGRRRCASGGALCGSTVCCVSLQLRMSRAVQFYQRCLLLPLQALKRNISVKTRFLPRARRINHAATHLHLEKLLEVSGVGVGEEFCAVVDERLWRVVRRHDDLQQARAAHTSQILYMHSSRVFMVLQTLRIISALVIPWITILE